MLAHDAPSDMDYAAQQHGPSDAELKDEQERLDEQERARKERNSREKARAVLGLDTDLTRQLRGGVMMYTGEDC
jgi:hypothetical protein